ncbi:tRNA wybutosine-synthesizing protein 2 [Colletotrichum sidae]|uniref:tRNA wybutosine-synthesizing protein 2 n=1 Tax=Colletotrichum sidae TaxID=1347389 RepID=A0A4R8TD43_9PEZI|nr:tRNA wybutosine-synthesizing protein 2 [Colletotrichum sidae]
MMAAHSKKPRSKKPKPENPISAAARRWLSSLPREVQAWNTSEELENLLNQHTPKRFIVYEPMVLLPAGSFDKGAWPSILAHAALVKGETDYLWSAILHEVSKTCASVPTHLAVNEGIPLQRSSADPSENILRTPSGLKILHGDFGPASNPPAPAPEDFDAAFWVSTKQNGILQTWAPRWTMFSRGNIKEKTRLLDFHAAMHSSPGAMSHLHRRRVPPAASAMRNFWAVDLYAGIGYFTFSYARLGLRVLCWELNPWSVEALRRGAVANGWSVKVVQGKDLRLRAAQLKDADEQIVVFLQDNQEAAGRIAEMHAAGTMVDILHVNGGLLPTSEPTWKPAWDMTAPSTGDCWLHLHENVGVHEIESRRAEIQKLYDGWAVETDDGRAATVEHVELVKTYAPDVWHCVFDVHITRSNSVT